MTSLRTGFLQDIVHAFVFKHMDITKSIKKNNGFDIVVAEVSIFVLSLTTMTPTDFAPVSQGASLVEVLPRQLDHLSDRANSSREVLRQIRAR
jgi:hypothetical protein